MTAVAESPRNVKQKPRRLFCRLYPQAAPDRWFFVPAGEHRLLHEASNPRNILRRIAATADDLGLPECGRKNIETLWDVWRKKYGEEIADYFYDGTVPAGKRFRYLNQIQDYQRSEQDGEIFEDEYLRAMRQHAHFEAIAKHLNRHPNGCRKWLNSLPATPWAQRYCKRGETPPANIQVATKRQTSAVDACWNWPRLIETIGITDTTYFRYVFEFFPRHELHDWLLWLWGAGYAPAGTHVVPEAVVTLKERLSEAGICAAARRFLDDDFLPLGTMQDWKNDPVKVRALQDIDAHVRAGRQSLEEIALPTNSEAIQALSQRSHADGMLRRMLAYVKASTTKAITDELGTNAAKAVREADGDVSGTGPRLQAWLNDSSTACPKTGYIGENLLVLPDKLRAIQAEASRLRAEYKLSDCLSDVPKDVQQRWFYDRIIPESRRPDRSELRRELVDNLRCEVAPDETGIAATQPDRQWQPALTPLHESDKSDLLEPDQKQRRLLQVFDGSLSDYHVDVRDVVFALLHKREDQSNNEVARDALGGNEKRARSAVNQINRYIRNGRLTRQW